MKAFVKKLAKFKKAKHAPVSNTGSAPVGSSLADSVPSAPAGSATASAQVIQATDVTVSVQLMLSH